MLVDIGGVRLNTVEAGAGHPIIFLSGLGGTWSDWEQQLDALSGSYRCIAVDHRCHGASDRTWGALSIDLWTSDIVALCEVLGIEHTHVVGLSLGGMVAQRMGLSYPELVDSAVFACTLGRPKEGARELADAVYDAVRTSGSEFWMAATSAGLEAKMDDPHVRRMLRNAGSNDPDTILRGIPAVLAHDVWDELAGFKPPALVIQGGNDVGVPVDDSRALARQVPQGTFRLVSGASHFANIDQPDAFNAALVEFFDRHPCSR
jgi:pimeloyl-ACP methyl ester carboxylesterase